MAIRMRQGLEADFNPDKMVPGEWAVSTDAKIVRMCFAPGIIKEIASAEEVKDAISKGLINIKEAEENALSNISDGLDKTLSVEGKAAESKATGEKISQLSSEIADTETTVFGTETTVLENLFTDGIKTGDFYFYKVATITNDVALRKVIIKGVIGTAPVLVVVRPVGTKNNVVYKESLLINTGEYVKSNVNFDCVVGDKIFIGGEANSLYCKALETGDALEQIKTLDFNVGDSVTINTSPNYPYSFDVALYGCEKDGLTKRVEFAEQNINRNNAVENILYGAECTLLDTRSNDTSNASADYYKLFEAKQACIIYHIINNGLVNTIPQLAVVDENNRVKMVTELNSNIDDYVETSVFVRMNKGDVLYIGGVAKSVKYYSSDVAEVCTTIKQQGIQVGDVVSISRATTSKFYYDCAVFGATEGDLLNLYNAFENFKRADGTVYKETNEVLLKYHEISEDYGFIGRWYDMDVDGVSHKVTNNCGSEIYFKVSDTESIDINFTPMTDGNAYFAYSIDGNAPVRQIITNPTVPMPDTGEHLIRVITDGITESIGKWDNGTGFAFNGVNVNGGSIIGLLPQNKLIAFFGDSITEGIRALGIAEDDMGDTNSATGAYPWYTCQNLKAVSHRVGYGATGVLSVGSFNPCINAIKYFYEGVKATTVYPDLIVLNHGHNDSSYTSEEFVTAYNEVLNSLRIKFPSIKVACVVPFSQRRASEIKTCCEGKDWCVYIDSSAWEYEGADSVHPTAEGAKVLGRNLAKALIENGLI